MFERFTPETRKVTVKAEEIARQLKHGYIGTEHQGLSLLESEDAVLGVALADVDRDEVAHEILRICPAGEGDVKLGHIPFTPRAKKVFEFTLRETLQLGHKDIAPYHLLLGLIREGEGVAAQVFAQFGVDLVETRKRVVSALPPAPKVAEPTVIELLDTVISGLKRIRRILSSEEAL